MAEHYGATVDRTAKIRLAGYLVIEIWECDWKALLEDEDMCAAHLLVCCSSSLWPQSESRARWTALWSASGCSRGWARRTTTPDCDSQIIRTLVIRTDKNSIPQPDVHCVVDGQPSHRTSTPAAAKETLSADEFPQS